MSNYKSGNDSASSEFNAKDFWDDILTGRMRNYGPKEAKASIPYQRKTIEERSQELESAKSILADLEKIAYGKVRSLFLKSDSPISENPTPQDITVPDFDSYDPHWNWKEKVMYAVKHYGRPLRAKEITEFLIVVEPGIVQHSENVWNLISKTISNMGKDGQLHPFKIKCGKINFYAHPLMVNDQGEVELEYLWKIPNA